ncbi:MAG: hypothetical protein CML46_22120 [Rhodobacteraceae bacterium]|nr:hypothetical protein [Paracoccaceae bacterium]
MAFMDRIRLRKRAVLFCAASLLGFVALVVANLMADADGFWFALIPATLALGGFAQAARTNTA